MLSKNVWSLFSANVKKKFLQVHGFPAKLFVQLMWDVLKKNLYTFFFKLFLLLHLCFHRSSPSQMRGFNVAFIIVKFHAIIWQIIVIKFPSFKVKYLFVSLFFLFSAFYTSYFNLSNFVHKSIIMYGFMGTRLLFRI